MVNFLNDKHYRITKYYYVNGGDRCNRRDDQKKKMATAGIIDNRSLTGKEKLLIWILTFLSPFVSGAVFYYGWRKFLPLLNFVLI